MDVLGPISPEGAKANTAGNELLPYLGRAAIIPSNAPIRKDLAIRLDAIRSIQDASLLSVLGDTKKMWTKLRDDLECIKRNLESTDENYGIEQYKLEILQDTVIPYLDDMKSRFHVDDLRIRQIKSLLSIINYCAPIPVHQGGESARQRSNKLLTQHPAEVLSKIDDLLVQVQSGMWSSQLQTLLRAAVDKQWRPILADNQAMLRNIGSRLVGVGLVELIGRPLLMLYPAYLITATAIHIANEVDHKQRFRSENCVKMIKGIMLLWGASKLVSIMTLLNGLGMSCLLIGVMAVAIATNDSLTKITAPLISQHFIVLETLLQQYSAFEKKSFAAVTTYLQQSNHEAASSSSAANPTQWPPGSARQSFTAAGNDEISIPVIPSSVVDAMAEADVSQILHSVQNIINELDVTQEISSLGDSSCNILDTYDSGADQTTGDNREEDYDILSVEELEAVSGYQSPHIHISEKGSDNVLRRRNGPSKDN